MRLKMLAALAACGAAAGAASQPAGNHPPLLPPVEGQAIASELSGSGALRFVQALSLHHRMRGSDGFNAAAEAVRARLADYGLSDVEMISLPADGQIFYGTQRSRQAWNASFAELWDLSDGGRVRVASWADQPIVLAQDSVSGAAEADLVDIGGGTPAEMAGKDLAGKLVLTSAQPSAVQAEAVGRRGAAGIVSWAQNQRTAWWGEDRSLIRWGHLDSFAEPGTFAFMVSPAQAASWRERLGRGEAVRLSARVEAGRTPGAYLIPTAVIPGRRRDEEIVFSCHLDHPSPGANDDASGCAGILEIARSLNRLVADGDLPPPERTIRFIWPAEIEATIALLVAWPDQARRTRATVHLDMIGGDTEITKSILRVYGPPPSLPSFVGDVAFAIGRFVNAETLAYASSGSASYPLTDAEGSRRALQAEIGGFNEGSDHQVWAEGTWRVPVVYIADWPDRYIHTQRDVPANLDPTKMKRAMFIAAASAWYLANLTDADPALASAMRAEALERRAAVERRTARMAPGEAGLLRRHLAEQEEGRAASVARFTGAPLATGLPPVRWEGVSAVTDRRFAAVYRRNPSLQGPMDAFGYSWLSDHLERAGLPRPALLARAPAQAEGPSFGYEALNLVDGRRTVHRIRDDLFASVGPAPVEEVADYLDTLARLGVLERVR
ncbi:MAG: M28 family peptidase [Allosphingosinicella sp.]|uniref:M28 family peptidase n=1 Tax=Allosphingosinicella sp. TaxID=2823234 RepID=UPI003942C7F6